MMLTDDERDRFAIYLEQDAADSEQMAKQCESIGQAVIAKKYRMESVATTIVARRLRSVETMKVSGE